MDRILGIIEGDQPGPLVICVAALHGNEQIGLHAFRNVFGAIMQHGIHVKGKIVGIAGNLKAIQSNVRFIDYDLNRVWVEDRINNICHGTSPELAEDEELVAIKDIIQKESQGVWTEKVLIDLHSTSSDKGNFLVVPSDEIDHPILKAVGLPIVVNLDNYLMGTLLSYYHKLGFVSCAFEGGTIGTNAVFQLHTSGLWEILDQSGCISHHDHELEDHYINQLEEVSRSLPEKVSATYRHSVHKQDGFRMLPGFHNFQPVQEGQHLAQDKNGPIYAPKAGMVFLPLYQTEGEDGFFLVEEIKELDTTITD
jgi:succinylglutamate desuccinylase